MLNQQLVAREVRGSHITCLPLRCYHGEYLQSCLCHLTLPWNQENLVTGTPLAISRRFAPPPPQSQTGGDGLVDMVLGRGIMDDRDQ